MMNFRSPHTDKSGGDGSSNGGARVLRSDSNDSNDSGFGDDSLPPDEYIQQRLHKMNTLMGFGDEPGIDELAVMPAIGSAPAPAYGGPVTTSPSLTPYERLQALSLNEGGTSTLQLVDDAASLPTPEAARFFGAQPLELDYANNRTFMADDDDYDNDEDDAYVITWEGGQLGLLFKANAADQVVIRRVNKKGTALGLHCARAGDVLVGLNGISVHGVPFLEIIEQLKHPRFPLKLEFEPMKFNALPPSIASSAGLLPPYLFNRGGAGAGASATGAGAGVGAGVVSPTSSAGTIEVTDQDASFVLVPRDAGRGVSDDRARRTLAGAEYDVVWDDGPLGCGLKHRNGFPTVKTASTAGVSASVAQICAGDVLLIINGYKTHEIGFKSAITMLQRAPKPIYLRFRRQAPAPLPPSTTTSTTMAATTATATTMASTSMTTTDPVATTGPACVQYQVLWSDGPLGIQIKSGAHGLVYVSRLTGAGNPSMTKLISPGDIFVRIADVDVASRGIAGAFDLLKSVHKPVVLVFEKPGKGDAAAVVSVPTDTPTANLPAPSSPSGPVPSFRKLREQQAAVARSAAQPIQGITRTQSAGGRQGVRHPIHHPHDGFGGGDDDAWQTRTAPYPSSTIDATIRMQRPVTAHSERGYLDCEDVSETGSQYSNARTEPALPRFSDIEAGRVAVTTEVTALPPPPPYFDTFTQSGRLLDDVFDSVRVAPGSPPQSESASVASDRHLASNGSLPPPPFPPAHEADAFNALPPPPQYASFYETPSQPTTRLQELRQQYIEAQRKRNATHFSGTVMSSYSDLDDSDVMRQQPPGVVGTPGRAPLPLPELWVRWSEGPLGITFKRKNGQIIVSRLTGAGFSAGIEQLRTGDWLVSFNNYTTENLRLSETMELLKRLPKPIDMRFVVQ